MPKNPWSLLNNPDDLDSPYSLGAPSLAGAAPVAQSSAVEEPVVPSLPQVQKGSGLSQEVTRDKRSEGKTATQEMLQMTPEQWQSAYENFANTPAFQQQAQGIDRLENLLSMGSKTPAQVDYSPLLALVDTWTGSNLSKGYKRPQTGQESVNQAAQYAAKIQDDRRDLSKTIIDAISKQRAGQRTELEQVVDLIRGVSKAEDPNKFVKSGGKPYDPSRDVEKLQKSLAPLEGLRTSMNQLDTLVGGFDTWTKGKNIPGIGAIEGKLPSFLQSDKGTQVNAIYGDMKDSLLRARSGAQINEYEYRRLAGILGQSVTGGEREFIESMKHFRTELKAIMQQKEAAFRGTHPEVIDLYRKGGGSTSEDVKPGAPQQQGPSFMDYLKQKRGGKS